MSAVDRPAEGEAPLVPYEKAVETLVNAAVPVTETESVRLQDALGRVLAKSLVSAIDVPPADNSAMDGYAVYSRQLDRDGPVRLVVSQRIPAGRAPSPLAPGTAARIFTGAPIPEGANAVIKQELVALEDDAIVFNGPCHPGAHIRRAGEDIARGTVVLEPGLRLRAQELGVAASVGTGRLDVFRRLRVGVIFTGDELREPGQPLEQGQIYDSNRYTLVGLLQTLGCEAVDFGIVGDTPEATRAALVQAAAKADLVVTTGGVSVGEEDHMRAAIESLGELKMWRLGIKPGKPLVFAEINGVPLLGLPGNPVSVLVTFCLFASPFIKRRQGLLNPRPVALRVRSGFDWRTEERREFVRARLATNATGESVAQIYHHQGSGVLGSTVWSDGLVNLPADACVAEGDWVEYLPYNALLA